MSTTPPPVRRRWAMPIICILLIIAGQSIAPLLDWADVLPAWRLKLAHAGLAATVLSVITLSLWFFCLASFSARLRLWTLGLLGLLPVAGFASIREFDFDGNLGLILRWRWVPSAQRRFDESREEPEPAKEARPISLAIDDVSDFPRYRGTRGDGVVTPLELYSTKWADDEPKVVWRRRCGGGYGGFAVAGTVAVTMEQRHGEEAIVCYDRDTGRENWVCSYEAHFRDPFGDGPRATPTIHDGCVYALGGTGLLTCVEGVTGKQVWQKDALSGNRPVIWGVSGSPLVVEDLGVVIVAPGGKAGPSVAAYDLRDGSEKWTGGEPGGGYSSPQLATLAGRRQVVLFDAGGLAGFDVTDGKELWRHRWKTFADMNIIQPIVLSEDRVFVSSEASNGSAMIQVVKTTDGYEASVLWETNLMSSKFSNPVALGGGIYGLSIGRLTCLNERTGERRWRGSYYGHGQLLAAGGSLVVLTEQGAVALVAADSSGFRQQAFRHVFRYKTWNTPALTDRRLFIRNAAEMACLELPKR